MPSATSGAEKILPRSAVDPALTWDLTKIFAGAADWEASLEQTTRSLGDLSEFRGRLGESPETLLAALQKADELKLAVARLHVWAELRLAEDSANAEAVALIDRAIGLEARAAAAAAFIDAELLTLPAEHFQRLAADPQLAQYGHLLASIERRRPHVRSVEVEEVLAQTGEIGAVPEAVYTALEDADLQLGTITGEDDDPITLAQGNLTAFLRHPNRAIRRATWETSADAYLSNKHVFAAALSGSVKGDVFRARAHNFDTALEATLFRDAIPTEVFHQLIDTVWKNLPTWHRYFRVRRHLLGLPEGDFHGWDITAPIGDDAPVVSFEEGMELIAGSLAPMGEEYVASIRQGIADRWVDRCANLGKGSGAFSSGTYGTMPYISMVYNDDLPSVSTLTHELGHSMHSYLAWKHTPPTYAQYSMFAAETASNFHQALLGKYLLDHREDRAWQIATIEERMGNHLRYLFTMPILARFELDCHTKVEQGDALTAEGMCETLAGFYKEGYGGEVDFDADRMGITWARFGHLYSCYYVFQYATGIAAAAALAAQVREEGEPARRRYLNFLSAGGNGYPIDRLREAGIDMTSAEPVQRAFDILAGYVDRLESYV